ncbi:MAG: hypothetical protein ACYCX4_07705 [Bacillota bacterium]
MELASNLASPKEDSLRRLEEYRKWLEYLAWLGVKVEKPCGCILQMNSGEMNK